MKLAVVAIAALLAAPLSASADTLYQAAPPAAGPGHPLRLGADHRAQQIGDLVYIVFDFASSNSNVSNYSGSNQFNASMAAGTGNLGFSLLRNGAGLSGGSGSQAAKSANGSTRFMSTMMATITDVSPDGTLQVQGDQDVVVNGQHETLHITGLIRPEDIDSTDAVPSSRVADVKAVFKNDDQKSKGLLQRIVDFLF